MAAPASIQLYTTDEPLDAKNVTYKGLIVVNKVRTDTFGTWWVAFNMI